MAVSTCLGNTILVQIKHTSHAFGVMSMQCLDKHMHKLLIGLLPVAHVHGLPDVAKRIWEFPEV